MSDEAKRKLGIASGTEAGETPGINGREGSGASGGGEVGGGLMEIRSSGAESWDLQRLPAADSLPVGASFAVAPRPERLRSEEWTARALERANKPPSEATLQLVFELLQDVLLGQQLLAERLERLAGSAEAAQAVGSMSIPYFGQGSVRLPSTGGGPPAGGGSASS
ncbi:hypothetical protein HGI30_09390 [Paenibacillus albicereus]|uniref:Uncharacterized protein n=1 Tax=Paenibacillus albicereus TaxID=2726185 RepID=A0A6H2GWF6_9BACL|nr:hypothetical protein [Paenibacillus albicereus]QJC51737.1 hypothetical protein HGI30_09390 [Paenibacillus albicereus]